MKKIKIFILCLVLFGARAFSADETINLADICAEVRDGEDCVLYASDTDTDIEIDGTGKSYYDEQYIADVVMYNNFKTAGGTSYRGTSLVFSNIDIIEFGYTDTLGQNVIDLSLGKGGVLTFDVDQSILFSNLELIDVSRVTLQGTDDIEAPLVITVGDGVTSIHTEAFDWEAHPNGTEFFISGSLQFEKIRFDDSLFGVNTDTKDDIEGETREAIVTVNGSVDLIVSVGFEVEETKATGTGYMTDLTFHNQYLEYQISSLTILGNGNCVSFEACHNGGSEPTSMLENSRISIATDGVMDVSGAVNVKYNGALIVNGRLYASEFNVEGSYSYIYSEDSAENPAIYEEPVEPDPIYHEGMISITGDSNITGTELFSVVWFKSNKVSFSEVVDAQIENFDVRDLEFDSSTVHITNLIYFDDSLPDPEPDPDETSDLIFINEDSSLYNQNREEEIGESSIGTIVLKNNSEVTIDSTSIGFADIILEDEGGTLTINNLSSEFNSIFLGKESFFNTTNFYSSRDVFTLYNEIQITDTGSIENGEFNIYMVSKESGGGISAENLSFSGYNSFVFVLEPKYVYDTNVNSKGRYNLGTVNNLTLEEGAKFDFSVDSILYKISDIKSEGSNYYFEYYRAKNYSGYLIDIKNSNKNLGIILSKNDAIKLDNAIAIGSFLDSRLDSIIADPEGQAILYNLTLAIDGNASSTADLINSLSQVNVDASGTNYKDIETVSTSMVSNIYNTFNNKDIENTPWVSYISNIGTNDDMDSNLSEMLFGFTRSTSDTNVQFGASLGLIGGKAKSAYKKNQYAMLSFAGYFNLAVSDVSSFDVVLINFFNRVQGDRYLDIIKAMPEYYNPSFVYNENIQSLSLGFSRRILFNKNTLSTRFSANIMKFSSFDYTESSSYAALGASYSDYTLSNLGFDLNYSYYMGYSGDYLLNFGANSAYYLQGDNGLNIRAGFADSSIAQGVDERWKVMIIPFSKYKIGFNASLSTSNFIVYIKYSYEGSYQSASFGINYYKGFATYSIKKNAEKDLKDLL